MSAQMQTPQTETFASLSVAADPKSHEKGRRFLLAYRDEDEFMDITLNKLAITLMTGSWEPTLVMNYGNTLADVTAEDVLDAFLARASGDVTVAATIVPGETWQKTVGRCGLHALDYLAISAKGRVMKPALGARLLWTDVKPYKGSCASEGARQTAALKQKAIAEGANPDDVANVVIPVEIGIREEDDSPYLMNPEVVPKARMAGWETLREVADATQTSFATMKSNAYELFKDLKREWAENREKREADALAQAAADLGEDEDSSA